MSAQVLGWEFEGHRSRVRLADVYAFGRRGARRPALPALVGRESRESYRLGQPGEGRLRPLFEELANLRPGELERDPAPLVDFASTWGFLGSKLEHFSLAPGAYEPPPIGTFGERVEFWIWHVRQLRDALALARACEAKGETALAELVKIQHRREGRVATYLGAHVRNLGEDGVGPFEWAMTHRRQAFHVEFPKGDLRAAGFRVLLAMIDQSLGSSRLGLEPDARAPFGIALVARPQSLLEAAWAQFASHVARGDITFQCEACGRISTDERAKPGPTREVCNQACKQKRRRDRLAAKSRRARTNRRGRA